MLALRYPGDARRLSATGPIVRVDDGMRNAHGTRQGREAVGNVWQQGSPLATEMADRR